MERPPHYDFRDVLWAPGKALSPKKIAVMTGFLLLALAVYDLFCYLALAAQGENLSYVWNVYGFFPLQLFPLDSPIALGAYALGLVAGILCLMMGFLGVAVINFEEMRGYPFTSITTAIKFAFRRAGQLFLSELTIGLFVLFVVLLYALLGLVSRIPFIGEWIYALGFAFPGFLIAALVIVVGLVAQVSILLMPAAAAANKTGETFDAILETFSTAVRQPARWMSYTVYSVVAAKVCGFVYAYFSFRAVQFMVWTSGIGGGRERLEGLVSGGLSHLPTNADLVTQTFNIWPGVDWSFSISRWTWNTGSDAAVGYVMALMLFLIFASVWGYMLATLATAQARGYVALRYIKDRYQIDQEDSQFYTDEPINPPIEGQESTAE
ncbi:MAG: hypothetical protein ABIE70_08915 [bacterium]